MLPVLLTYPLLVTEPKFKFSPGTVKLTLVPRIQPVGIIFKQNWKANILRKKVDFARQRLDTNTTETDKVGLRPWTAVSKQGLVSTV